MIKFLKDKFRHPYHVLKYRLGNHPQVGFEYDTLPLIDKDVSLDDVLKTVDVPNDTPYDLREKLEFWRENGYVVLENILPPDWLDKLWAEVEDVIDENEKYNATALVHQFNNQKPTPLKNVPKELLKGIGSRINDYHNISVGAKKVMGHRHISTFLKAALSPKLTAFQSLIFKYSSQQGTHQDFPWVRSNIASHLAAAWIPLEDVHPDSGPLFYYPGSHKMPKFDFGHTGHLYKEKVSLFNAAQFEKYLVDTCQKEGHERKVLLIKKGDVLIWHGALAHGGSPIKDSARTRKSFVCHYSTADSYPKHRFEEESKSASVSLNGIEFYTDPLNAKEENILGEGEKW